MKSLELQSLICGYNKKPVLNTGELTFNTGVLCGLLGLNGSGKSTLLKTICGIQPAVSGKCLYDGRDLSEMKIRRRARHISYIPQRPGRLEAVTVTDVLLMGLNPWLGMLESPSRAMKRETLEKAERMGIAEFADRDFSKLSEGQKQRILMARAVIQNTAVMLMDEPDSALDYKSRREMLRRLSELVHKEGKIGIMATHDPNFALTYCDRIVILKDGTVKRDFNPADAELSKVETALSELYGSVRVLELEGKRYMLPRD